MIRILAWAVGGRILSAMCGKLCKRFLCQEARKQIYLSIPLQKLQQSDLLQRGSNKQLYSMIFLQSLHQAQLLTDLFAKAPTSRFT